MTLDVEGVVDSSVGGDEYLVQMPAPICPRSKAPQLAGIALSKLQSPAANRFIRNFYATFGE